MALEAPVYVVGFPKSGNTWLLRMMCDICDANIQLVDPINRADYRADSTRVLHKSHFPDLADLPQDARLIYVVRDIRDVVVSGFFHNHRFIPEELVLAEGPRGLKSALLRSYFRHHVRRLNRRWCGNFLRTVSQRKILMRLFCRIFMPIILLVCAISLMSPASVLLKAGGK